MTELRQSSKHCDFGESLNDMLRDRLVCDSRIQRRLLSELNLTFQKAYDLALVMEIADKDTQDTQKAFSTLRCPCPAAKVISKEKFVSSLKQKFLYNGMSLLSVWYFSRRKNCWAI